LRKITLTSMLVFVLLCFASTAYAIDWTEWPEETNVPVNKVWYIMFDKPINTKTVYASVYIVDENGNRANIWKASTNKKVVTIDVKPDYLYGTQYRLYINGLKTVSGEAVKPIKMKFTTEKYRIKGPLSLYSDDSKKLYIGKLTSNKLDSKSIFNKLGVYGSELSSKSIWNELGVYGSQLSRYSAFNDLALKPPKIIDGNNYIVGRLTKNNTIPGGIDPDEIFDILVKLGF